MKATLIATLALVVVCVLFHYEALRVMRRAGAWMHRRSSWHRWHLSLILCGLLFAHVAEVIMFAFAYHFLARAGDGLGKITGAQPGDLSEKIYFSFSSYTSLGYGDLVPLGPLRFMAGMEALTGLLLITWTASFMYMQMQSTWGQTGSRP